MLRRRRWSGNIREFGNAIERALILCRDGRLTADSLVLPDGELHPAMSQPAYGTSQAYAHGHVAGGGGGVATMHAPSGPTLDEASFNLDVLERLAIQRALVATGGHRTKAARMLGISERTLRNKLKLV